MLVRSPLGIVKAVVSIVGILFMLVFVPSVVASTQVFSQTPNAGGGQYKSSWYAPDGMDGDEYSFDNFTLATGTAITEVHWRGCYTNYLSGAGRAPVYDFTVSIYRSIGGNSQPDLGTGGRLARYVVGSNAGETVAGTVNGVIMYDYAFTLPAPFQAVGETTYWVQIEASQGVTPTYGWPPDWSLAASTSGNNSHFRRITGGPMQTIGGDLTFSLYTSDAPTVTIAASASPASAGTVSGAGPYPVNSTVSLIATPNTGWGFVNWTVAGSQVSTNSHYTFAATANRTLVANFVPAYSVVVTPYPSYGGTVSGAGTYNSGSTVTVTATPAHGFVFSGWSDGATTATHTFTANADVQLAAFFDTSPLAVSFDLDNAPQYTSLPINLSVNGLGAHFSATGSGFSIQSAGTMGFTPQGFGGLCLYPNSVFPADLVVDFSESLTDFSIMYAPQELGCDSSATMRATAYMNGAFVATATATAPTPGTWPTGTLAVAAPVGFNRVVVHFDSHAGTCQDWGPIFLADNMIVTRMCVAPTVATPPQPQSVCTAGTASFFVAAGGSGPFNYQWRHGTTPVDATLNPTAGTDTLVLTNVQPGDAGLYDCVITGYCGNVTSGGAQLMVSTCCPADLGQAGGLPGRDGVLDNNDFIAFINYFFTGAPEADVGVAGGFAGSDGVYDNNDFIAFINLFFAGC